MKYERVESPVKNELLKQYWENDSTVQSFFEYELTDVAFENRAKYLQTKNYDRKALSEIIRSYMERFEITSAVEQNLQYLSKDAFVVVGGQQAGLLTGPLFSIYKAITVILLANQQSKKLNHPVIPVFWVAGEDHDLDEINHTFVVSATSVQKAIFGTSTKHKLMASETAYDEVALKQYVNEIFAVYGETVNSNQFLEVLHAQIEANRTYTEFFASIMNYFFAEFGLLMIDAAYAPLRQLEAPFFESLIVENEAIAQSVVAQEQALVNAGFTPPLEARAENANLFYVKDGERFLLEKRDGYFFNGLGAIKLTESQMLEIAKSEPTKLSNNVVTRPLMQDFVFPVLAFVGGPGELAYWATLKEAFHTVNMQMPPFMPRLSLTIVDRQAQTLLDKRSLTTDEVLLGKVTSRIEEFLASVQDEELQTKVAKMEQQLLESYEQLSAQMEQKGVHLEKTVARNMSYHKQQFDYLKDKLQQDVQLKHDVAIKQYQLLENLLLPNGKPQERLFNPFQFFNLYGPTLVEDILALDLPVENTHYAVLL